MPELADKKICMQFVSPERKKDRILSFGKLCAASPRF